MADQRAQLTAAAFTIRERGNTTKSWLPKKYEIADATGNHWRPFASRSWVATNSPSVIGLIHGALWADENAWRLRVTFERQEPKATVEAEFLAKPDQVEDYRKAVQE